MIELKLKNPDTGLFEECSVSKLTTPRFINGVAFDGSRNIDINEKEVVVSNLQPTDNKNKLWISGVAGASANQLSVNWSNINTKPSWTSYFPGDELAGNELKVLTVKEDASGYYYALPKSSLSTKHLSFQAEDVLSSGTITNIP